MGKKGKASAHHGVKICPFQRQEEHQVGDGRACGQTARLDREGNETGEETFGASRLWVCGRAGAERMWVEDFLFGGLKL